ncbi:MAG: acyltransferase family protein [Odoribacter sp.]|nr:acyltransferase family protein [Odoribacter sp.]
MSTIAKPRLHYFDMLKGVAIFLVVMGHIITMCVREVDRTALFKFIERIHMPLFFFISGWFTFKISADGRVAIPKIGQRALRLLLPMVAVSSLWVYYFPHSGLQSPLVSTFEGLWANTWKNGYWFTFVLFQIFVIYAATSRLLDYCKTVYASVGLGLAIWAALLSLYLYVLTPEVSAYLSLELTASFYPAFMFGVLARRYRDSFMSAIHSSSCQTVAMLVLAVTMYMCCWPWEFGVEGLGAIALNAVLHISLSVIAFAVFESWADIAFDPQARPATRTVASIWEYVGTRSLGIYLLHYFFLFPMGVFRETLSAMNLSLVPMAVFSAFWAVAVIAMVLLIMKILSFSKPLNLLLTGSK